MNLDVGTVLSGVVAVIGGIVWLVRLEGRVNLSDDRFQSLKLDLHEIKDDVKALLRKPLERL